MAEGRVVAALRKNCNKSNELLVIHKHLLQCSDHSSYILGECLELPGGTALPRRQCFCQFGYMGRDCGQESPLTEKSFNKAAYNVEETRYEKEDVKGSL